MAFSTIFLGRQPILDRNQRVVAYELLFRTGNTPGVAVTDDMQATASVIHHAFSAMGVHSVLGTQPGFINVSAEMLLSDRVELLPKAQVVLELLETIVIDDAVVERCRALKRQGFTLALDDFVYHERYLPLLSIVDIVKVDLLLHTPAELRQVVATLKRWPVKILAEKVDSAAQATLCQTLGFDLFQGYYFARPAVLTARRTDPGQLPLIEVLDLVLKNADTHQIERVFNQHPSLTGNLIRLLTSMSRDGHRSMPSLSQAIIELERSQLHRWLQLLLFTVQVDSNYPGPLLLMAATRGKMMELLATRQQRHAGYGDLAFMAGTLSLVDSLIDKPLVDILGELDPDAPLAAALLRREGELGLLLQLVERIEQANLPRVQALLQQIDMMSPADLAVVEIEAMSWADRIAESAG